MSKWAEALHRRRLPNRLRPLDRLPPCSKRSHEISVAHLMQIFPYLLETLLRHVAINMTENRSQMSSGALMNKSTLEHRQKVTGEVQRAQIGHNPSNRTLQKSTLGNFLRHFLGMFRAPEAEAAFMVGLGLDFIHGHTLLHFCTGRSFLIVATRPRNGLLRRIPSATLETLQY